MKIYNYKKLVIGKVYKFENVYNGIDYFVDVIKRKRLAATASSLEKTIVGIFLGEHDKYYFKLLYKNKIIYFQKDWMHSNDLFATEVSVDSSE